jgi:tetratricopeptide (TPR) repeat protein
MPSEDIFISYAREDRQKVEVIARRLEQNGWEVWWDEYIEAGQIFADEIRRRALESRCIMVLWSTSSISSDWVKLEAAVGFSRNVLVPVLVENVELPSIFASVQASDLTDWDGHPEHESYIKLTRSIKQILDQSEVKSGENSPHLSALVGFVEEQLSLAFFQYFESRYLGNAKKLIMSIAPNTPTESADKVRLTQIHQLLEASLAPSLAEDADTPEMDNFRIRYPNDPWVPLLVAAHFYGNQEFADAAKYLETPTSTGSSSLVAAMRFFCGVCFLRSARDAEDSASKQRALKRADKNFRSARATAQRMPDFSFRRIALPSAAHFQGLVCYYDQRLDDAIAAYRSASKIATGGLKARTLNGIGYISFIKGRLEEAEDALLQALQCDSYFPYARTNYGYVLLAKNERPQAIEVFQSMANDARLKRESPRDVTLAQLALIHIGELDEIPVEDANKQYAEILRQRNSHDFANVSPPALRLSFIQQAVAETVYLDKMYYGLEVFALALFARALSGLSRLDQHVQGGARVLRLRGELHADISLATRLVEPQWLEQDHVGWFASITFLR